jgi:hypothetical protein
MSRHNPSNNSGPQIDNLPRGYGAWVIAKSVAVGGGLGAVLFSEPADTLSEQRVPSDNLSELQSREYSAEGALTGALALGVIASVIVNRIRNN